MHKVPCLNLLPNLSFLCLSYNPLGVLGDEIGSLRSLEELRLNNCDLLSLPFCIGNLRNLRSLSASGNKFELLPKSFGQLIQLRYLDLSKNRFIEVSGVKRLPLQRVTLAENPLVHIPSELFCLKTLLYLDLRETLVPERCRHFLTASHDPSTLTMLVYFCVFICVKNFSF